MPVPWPEVHSPATWFSSRVEKVEIAIAAVLACFSLAVVAFPLLMARRGDGAQAEGAQPPVQITAAALEFQGIRESIQTLQLDYELGKVTPEQYREQLQAYRLAAADALKRQGQEQPSAVTPPEPSVDATDS